MFPQPVLAKICSLTRNWCESTEKPMSTEVVHKNHVTVLSVLQIGSTHSKLPILCALAGMTRAHALATNTDVLNGIEETPGN
jgi:hypothetical protein